MDNYPLPNSTKVNNWVVTPHMGKSVKINALWYNSLVQHLDDHGVGSISEIFDGHPPFTPCGCIAQAWSVAKVLRAWQETMG